MRVLVTGHEGYIGVRLVALLRLAGHDVAGLDSGLFAGADLGPPPDPLPALRLDVRDVTVEMLEGFDAVLHLAGISNDPLGDLDPECTFEINHRASVRLARVAREAGVSRFLFASSCSLYGASGGDDLLDESAPFRPVTPYGVSKMRVEEDVSRLARPGFSPVYLRCATVHGSSTRLRADLVVNNLVGHALLSGEVLLKSDGTPWRPLVHVDDVCRAYLALLDAPGGLVHNQAFNVGRTAENYRVSEVAEMVRDAVPGSVLRYEEGAGPDPRCYRVDCSKLEAMEGYQPTETVASGIEELLRDYRRFGLTRERFLGNEFLRIRTVRLLQSRGRLDSALRWQPLPTRLLREARRA
ncbi:MAG: NAD(P)-dependent oxidoreductase [Planctomycetes bacterium]|nr:NAD(P)-dependent oxidoreductase [Planctomycetota bacterium]